jgi:hypothetical protein
LRPAPMHILEEHYGDAVSGILRSGDFPDARKSWLVQRQMADASAVSRWFTLAVYSQAEAATSAVRRWEEATPTRGTYDLESGETTPNAQQPITAYRVVSLLVLFGEGSEAIASAIYDLATSDHEWLISSELGSEAKIALMAAAADG